MSSQRTFYRTRITLTVLHEEPIPSDTSVREVWRQCIEGDYSGQDEWDIPEVLDGPTMAAAMINQGSDPEFFMLDEEGNDLLEPETYPDNGLLA